MFCSELIIKPVRGDHWELVEPLYYLTDDQFVIQVPAGFQMDLASIPAIFQPLFPVHGKHTRAAVVHDWLYYNQGMVEGRTFTRLECDQIFLQAMIELGVSWVKRKAMYLGVRVGGWAMWD